WSRAVGQTLDVKPRSLSPEVTQLHNKRMRQFLLDGKVPCLRVRRPVAAIHCIRVGDRLRRLHGESVLKRQRSREAGIQHRRVRERRLRGEAARKLVVDRTVVKQSVSTAHLKLMLGKRPPGKAQARREVILVGIDESFGKGS